MLLSIGITTLNILLMVTVSKYLWKRYDDNVSDFQIYFLHHKLYFFIAVSLLVSVAIITVRYVLKNDLDALAKLTRWLILIWGGFCVSCTDIKERAIPNQCLLVLFLCRTVILLYEVFSNLEYWSDALTYPILGTLISGGIMGIAMLISRGGIGMGDLKLFLVVGYYTGSKQVFAVMFYTFFLSAVAGIFMLVLRKAKLKDTMPMAPFVCAGIVIEYMLLLLEA